MAYTLDKEGLLKLKVGNSQVRVFYRRPDLGEIIEALVRKMPRGDEAEDAQRILMTNLDLGSSCITGVGEGELEIDGVALDTNPESRGFRRDWKDLIFDSCPLVLIALGQYLSAVPSFMEEPNLKKF